MKKSVARGGFKSFFRPAFSTAATNFLSSHEFMLVRSIGS
jgi:hypothetical protein